MSQAIITILQSFLTLALSATSSKQIQAIIEALIGILPWAIKEAQDLAPMIRNIIAVLQGNDAVTADQLAALAALDANADSGFEDAVAAYGKNHPALAPATPANPQTPAA